MKYQTGGTGKKMRKEGFKALEEDREVFSMKRPPCLRTVWKGGVARLLNEKKRVRFEKSSIIYQ